MTAKGMVGAPTVSFSFSVSPSLPLSLTASNTPYPFSASKKSLAQADKFDVPRNSFKLLHVPFHSQGVHGGHSVHGLHPEQLLSVSRTTS
jgi:hypothetical protein